MNDKRDFHQIAWGPSLEEDWRNLLVLAVREDLERIYDWTTVALVPEGTRGAAAIVARQAGVVAGLNAARITLLEFDRDSQWEPAAEDGAAVAAGQVLARLAGSARSLLTAERIVLNVLAHLSGIATLTRRFVDAVAGTGARIYDTRKTLPGWRRLEKYAVRCGGGHNHRLGLFDAVLIKDNHLALAAAEGLHRTPAEAVQAARAFLSHFTAIPSGAPAAMPLVEIEVDSLDQLRNALSATPDIVLLDNMTTPQLVEAVALRNSLAPEVELEASGGVRLDTVASIARTGIERISVGAITHSAPALDIALDWS
ncbi:MAG: carboxylating nicotinate-nucleotide diphosphorylase [Pirellulales bacterium]|nr:carboxylating nicotinate-nucleotide diphosphorylase [Pirellulales bacterium]